MNGAGTMAVKCHVLPNGSWIPIAWPISVADPFPVSRLRWRVQLGQRVQSPESSGGITEQFQGLREIWADIQPVGAMTFWGAMQIDSPVTHRITMRWISYIDNTWAVLRATQPPSLAESAPTDQGYQAPRYEVFRVRRVLELDGRKRFTVLDCELERVA